MPISPWLASTGFKKTEGTPVDVKEAANFAAIFPLLPTPETINFPLRLIIKLTAL